MSSGRTRRTVSRHLYISGFPSRPDTIVVLAVRILRSKTVRRQLQQCQDRWRLPHTVRVHGRQAFPAFAMQRLASSLGSLWLAGLHLEAFVWSFELPVADVDPKLYQKPAAAVLAGRRIPTQVQKNLKCAKSRTSRMREPGRGRKVL